MLNINMIINMQTERKLYVCYANEGNICNYIMRNPTTCPKLGTINMIID